MGVSLQFPVVSHQIDRLSKSYKRLQTKEPQLIKLFTFFDLEQIVANNFESET